MPVMDGWEFRAIQKDDERLKQIPVVAMSADRSPQAIAVSSEAYLRKPVDANELLRTLESLLRDREVVVLTERLQAAERLASLGRVAAGVGHEINNPLAFVTMNVHLSLERLKAMLAQGGERSEAIDPVGHGDLGTLAHMLTDAEVGLERIRQTVQNLQSLTRRAEKEHRDVNVDELIGQSVAMAWNQIVHRARFVDRRGGVPPVRGDGVALGQVFLNLILNAAQAIPEGKAESNHIGIASFVARGRVVVEISDSGSGIQRGDLPRIFEPFFTTKPVGAGTGLGLSICRQTVIDHGGELQVESEPGRGTLVRVSLPVPTRVDRQQAPAEAAPPEMAATTPRPPSEAGPVRRGRVLLIDDEALIGRVVQAALRRDADVLWFAHGQEAIAALEAGQTFDLILCDLAMPDIGGPDIFRMIEERWPAQARRVVFMTGGAFTPTLQAFVATTTQPVLAKPFTRDGLSSLARDYVRKAVASEAPPVGGGFTGAGG
jgi:signal transduction histidine kinase